MRVIKLIETAAGSQFSAPRASALFAVYYEVSASGFPSGRRTSAYRIQPRIARASGTDAYTQHRLRAQISPRDGVLPQPRWQGLLLSVSEVAGIRARVKSWDTSQVCLKLGAKPQPTRSKNSKRERADQHCKLKLNEARTKWSGFICCIKLPKQVTDIQIDCSLWYIHLPLMMRENE